MLRCDPAGWDVEGADAEDVDGHCFYRTHDGYRFPGEHDWEGMQGTEDEGDRIGMLLDLDQGSMTVWKNDVRLGVVAEGLSGPFCWAVSMFDEGESARIESAPAPPMTPEEMEQQRLKAAAVKAGTAFRVLGPGGVAFRNSPDMDDRCHDDIGVDVGSIQVAI